MKTDRTTHKATIKKKIEAPTTRHSEHKTCADCRAFTAFHAWHDQKLTPSFNWSIDFTTNVNIPSGKRAVIELVTATIIVPTGEKARLRLSTSLGTTPSNFDLSLTPQGTVAGEDVLMGTHTIRAYSDSLIGFDVNRDNAQTEGNAFICISGYLADA
jgi:hypothetical protein